MDDGVTHLLATYISDKYKKISIFPHKQEFPHWHRADVESIFYN